MPNSPFQQSAFTTIPREVERTVEVVARTIPISTDHMNTAPPPHTPPPPPHQLKRFGGYTAVCCSQQYLYWSTKCI